MDRIIAHDVVLYYQYLPATIIYNDIQMRFLDEDPGNKSIKMWGELLPSGNRVGKMTVGMSIMYSPFFFAAHWLAQPLGYEANGYTPPYRLALILSSLVFAIAGLYLLSLLLRKYFDPVITAITLTLLALGTNLYFYTTLEPTMTHAYSFFLYAAFIFLLDKWLLKTSWKNSIILGIISGLIVIIRPVNGIILLLFLLWNVGSWRMFTDRIRFLIKNIHLLVLVIILFLITIFPQLLYWKTVTGHWLFYGYGEEGFFFLQPKYFDGLFSYRKGWLVYTPIMVFSLLGFIVLYYRNRKLFFPIVIFTLINTYIIFSWWCWWYGGSFGQRSMIESYVLLAFPLAYLVNWIRDTSRPVFFVFLIIGGLFTAYNIFQSRQYYFGSIHWDSMSKKAYWETFMKWKPTEEFFDYLDHPDYGAAMEGER